MKGTFQIPSAKELREKLRVEKGKKMKRSEPAVGLAAAVDCGRFGSTLAFVQMVVSSQQVLSPEDGELLKIVIPSGASAYSDTSFVGGVIDSLLLSEDKHQLGEIGMAQAAYWFSTRLFQAVVGGMHLKKLVSAQEKRNQDLAHTNSQLQKQLMQAGETEKDLHESRANMTSQLQQAQAKLESGRSNWEKERVALLKRLESISIEAILKTRAELMEKFKAGK